MYPWSLFKQGGQDYLLFHADVAMDYSAESRDCGRRRTSLLMTCGTEMDLVSERSTELVFGAVGDRLLLRDENQSQYYTRSRR